MNQDNHHGSTRPGVGRRAVLTGTAALLASGALARAAEAATDQAGGAAGGTGTRPVRRDHPFMLVTPDEFDQLWRRARTEPWATWKATALAKAAEPYDPTLSIGNRVRQFAQIAGAASLTYIVDPERRQANVERILELIDTFDRHLYPELDSSNWERTVGAGSGFFHLVIGLDLVHPELSEAQRSAAEQALAKVGDWYYANKEGSWTTGRIGGYGVWAVYAGDTARVAESIEALRLSHEEDTAADGGLIIATNYAGHRYGSNGDRDAKSYYIDVLTRAGYFDYYADRDTVERMEYLLGYTTTPVTRRTIVDDELLVERDHYSFGNSAVVSGALWRSARSYSASLFGHEAARNAGWTLNRISNDGYPGMITHYVLTEQPPRTDAILPSRIYRGNGAWFIERSRSQDALAGALWNATKAGEHQHKDTNALHLTAYGEHVLRNSGYNGWNNGAAGFGWIAIHNRAVVNNTVLIDYDDAFTDDIRPTNVNDHQQKFGAGITEGFTGGLLDYACGDSGDALPNGRHLRNFVFVHPRAWSQGYWLLFDEVTGASPGRPASVALHPNADADPDVVGENQEYTYRIGGPFPRSSNDVRLSIFLAHQPQRVAFKPGPFASRGESFQSRYLYASYPTDERGAANILTVLFPHDRTHDKATMQRVSGSACSGASIRHRDGSVDHALESDGSPAGFGRASFRGTAAVFRERGHDLAFFFVRRGRLFAHGDSGFDATAPVSVYLEGGRGTITNPNPDPVEVTLHGDPVTAAKLNGRPAEVTSRRPGRLRIQVPPGTFQLELAGRR